MSDNTSITGNPTTPRSDGAKENGNIVSGASKGGYNTAVPTREPIVRPSTLGNPNAPARIVGNMVSGDPSGSHSPSARTPTRPPIEKVTDSATQLPAKGKQV
jgi:hypothetical protein